MRESVNDPVVLTLCSRHRGFVRLALQHGAHLVPVLAYGETSIMEIVRLPSIQMKCLRWVGYLFPLIPYGRWYAPIPNATPITVVIGDPLEIEQVSDPSDELVAEVHTRYYNLVKDLFENTKAAAGFPDMQLRLVDH